jgi:Kdo2-lipid IVA lauroyltransferase/acyltransferase
MARGRGPWLDGGEYLAIRLLVGCMRVFPRRLCVASLHAVASLAYRVMGSRRRGALKLVEQHLGLTGVEAERVVKGAFRTLALTVGETILLQRALKRSSLEDHVTFEGAEYWEQAVGRGRGVLLAMAHFGAWESTAEMLARRFQPVWAVGRALDNPRLDGLVKELREVPLAGTLPKEGSGRHLARLFKQGEVVGLLLDQNAGQHGVMLDFMGSPAMQHKVAGIMARRFGVAVLPLYVLREPGHLRFRAIFEEPILADEALADEDAELDVIRRVADSLEARIRETPEQWLWLHDRWRKAAWILRRQARQAARAKGIDPNPSEGTNGG